MLLKVKHARYVRWVYIMLLKASVHIIWVYIMLLLYFMLLRLIIY